MDRRDSRRRPDIHPGGRALPHGRNGFSDTTEKPSEDIWTQILDKLDTVGTVQRINTVISYDGDRGDYVSSVDFATLLAAAQQPEKYIVTAARREGGVEREYALKEIKQNADFTFCASSAPCHNTAVLK